MKYLIQYQIASGPERTLMVEDGKPLLLGHRKKFILDLQKDHLWVHPLSQSAVASQKRSLTPEMQVGDLTLRIRALTTMKKVETALVVASPKFKLPAKDHVSLDHEAQRFKKLFKGTMISGAVALLALMLIPATPAPEVPVEQIAPIAINIPAGGGAPGQVSSYEKSMQEGQKIQEAAARESAAKEPQSKEQVQKGLKRSFASLFSSGLTDLTSNSKAPRKTLGAAGAKAAMQDLMSMPAGGGLEGGNEKGGGSAGAVHKVALIGGGGGAGGKGVGYGTGTGGGVDGQGSGFLQLNLKEALVEEGLNKDEVGKVIHAHISEIRYCYESSMLRNPELEGKLSVNFVINGKGAVKTANVKESSVPDNRLDECILRRLAQWQFPLPKKGVDVAITYPFIFKKLRR